MPFAAGDGKKKPLSSKKTKEVSLMAKGYGFNIIGVTVEYRNAKRTHKDNAFENYSLESRFG